ncbi:MAG TPA: hypothetical protein VNB24_05555 [Acidimicrobiales bacterium]|nr:hypothetical protein [Acidimicrobiales bacterium]
MTTAGARRRNRVPSLETLVVATYGLLGVRLGARPIGDNSAFLHLRTGIDMVGHGLVPAIPRVDPYSFTARGEPWVVQSWLPTAVVGWVHRLGGPEAVVVLAGITMAALALLVASMARTGDVRRTAVAAGAALLVSGPFWTPRPLLVGLLCLALTIWVIERGKPVWWLVPIVWVWVNSHGSFPLGLGWIALRTFGDALDARARPRLQPLGCFVVGLLIGAVNPLGPRLLSFPLAVGEKREIFQTVIEWRTVDFQRPDGVVALAGLVVAALVLTRRPLPWRYALPVGAFLGLGLLAQRNLAPLGIVLAPALAASLRVVDVGDVDVDARSRSIEPSRVPVVFAGVLVALASLFLVTAATRPAFDFSAYPLSAVTWLEKERRFDAPHRVLARDTVGNFLELRRGRAANVFIDDRVDMYPLDVSRDYAKLLRGEDLAKVLDKWQIDTVLWEVDDPFVDRLTAAVEWPGSYRNDDWVVLMRTCPCTNSS